MCGGSSCRCISDCNPRARVGARPIYLACFARLSRFQSTRPAWGRDVIINVTNNTGTISIHTPRMGARLMHVVHGHSVPEISIHAPRVGARRRRRSCRTSRYLFQSTRPRRVRRTNGFANIHHILFQSTRPRRARLARASPFTSTASFQSTRPRRARPGKTTFLNAILAISIHAPA